MKLAHNIKISVFARDDVDAVKKGLMSLLPDSVIDGINKGDLSVDEQRTDDGLSMISLYLVRNRYCTDFLRKLFADIDGNMADEICRRIDQRCRCYIRLDKRSLLEGKKVLTDRGDCYHIRITMAVFPRKLDKAEEMICSLAKERRKISGSDDQS